MYGALYLALASVLYSFLSSFFVSFSLLSHSAGVAYINILAWPIILVSQAESTLANESKLTPLPLAMLNFISVDTKTQSYINTDTKTNLYRVQGHISAIGERSNYPLNWQRFPASGMDTF